LYPRVFSTVRSLRRTLIVALISGGLLAASAGSAVAIPTALPESANLLATTDASTTDLVTAWPTDSSTLDPAIVATDEDKELTMNIYQRLVEYKFVTKPNGAEVWNGLEVEPSLAKSWTINGPVITFHLRPGVKFYPSGNPVTASDVKFSFDRNFALPAGDSGDLNNGGLFKASQIKVINSLTVQFTFTNAAGKPAAFADSLATMRMPNYGIVDEKTVLEHATKKDPYGGVWLRSHVAGTGPYYIASREPGQQIVLKAVPNLWSGEPVFKTVTIRIVSNGNIASLVEGGDVNIATFGLSANDVTTLGKAGYTVWHENTPDFVFLNLAEDQGPLKNKLVRQAIADAVPYSSIVTDVYANRAERSLSYVNLKAPGYIPAWNVYQTNMARAKALMKQSGVGHESVTLTFSNAEPSYEDMAILIKNALAPIGISLDLVPTTPDQLNTDIENRSTGKPGSPSPVVSGMVMFNLSIYLDDAKSPVDFWSTPGNNTINYSRFDNPTVNRLQNEYQFAPNSPARNKAYEEIQRIVANDAGFIPLVITGRTTVTSPNLTGLSFSPEIGNRFWTLKLK
jgi:peptide/nickel transport system substrate-binding protein